MTEGIGKSGEGNESNGLCVVQSCEVASVCSE